MSVMEGWGWKPWDEVEQAADLQRRESEAFRWLAARYVVSTNGPHPPEGQEALFSIEVTGKRIHTLLEAVEAAMRKSGERE